MKVNGIEFEIRREGSSHVAETMLGNRVHQIGSSYSWSKCLQQATEWANNQPSEEMNKLASRSCEEIYNHQMTEFLNLI